VDIEFIREAQAAGLVEATPEQLIEMYDHGVDADFVREMRALGLTNLTPEGLVELYENGVESDESDE